jgi:hypothetical protein
VALNSFFKPKWKHRDPGVRKAAVEKLIDQALIADIAKTDDNEDVRRVAIKKLTNPAVLVEMLGDGRRGMGERLDVGRALEVIGWQPTNPHERALHLAALAGMKKGTADDIPHLLRVYDMGLVSSKHLGHILQDIVSRNCSDVRLLTLVLRHAVLSRTRLLEVAAIFALRKARERDADAVAEEMNSLLRDGIACDDEALQSAALTVLQA